MSVFVHSLWASSLDDYDSARLRIRTLFEPTEIVEATSFDMLIRTEQVEGDPGDAWIRPESSVARHQVALYVLNSGALDGPDAAQGLSRAVIGAASHLPALNADIMEELSGAISASPLLPDLNRDRVANLSVYEARVVTGDGERSITYNDPAQMGGRFRDDWAPQTSLTAATFRHAPLGVLVTAFADGQIWLEGAAPQMVPEVVAGTVSRLWFTR